MSNKKDKRLQKEAARKQAEEARKAEAPTTDTLTSTVDKAVAAAESVEPVTEPTTPKPEAKPVSQSVLDQLPDDLKALISNYQAIKDPELKAKAETNLAKLAALAEQAKDAEKWADFNKQAESELRSLFEKLQEESGVSLLGRKIVVAFAEVANPSYTHTIMGKHSSDGKGGRKGGGHGKVEMEGEQHASLHALCVAKDWKYNGRATAFVAVEKPQDMEGNSLDFTNTIAKVDGTLVVTRN